MKQYKLQRHLKERHLSMIAIGGSIGTGLFLASGSAIYKSGFGGALLAFLLIGLMIYFLMINLGEMSAKLPVAGSFNNYCGRFIDPALGFAMSYNYWFNWAITIAVNLTAASLLMKFWYPQVNIIYWCLLFFILILCLNLTSVRYYGESEYWLSLIKIIAIIAFIVVGFLLITNFIPTNIDIKQNIFGGDAPFHNGLLVFVSTLMIAGFAFQGTETFGIAAAETKNPAKSITKAVRKIFWRILLFYIFSIALIGCIIPYSNPHLLNEKSSIIFSPFTMIFNLAGMKHATAIMNIVVLISVLSAANASMYTASRTLWYIAKNGQAHKCLAKINKHGIPILALLLTSAIGALTFFSYFFHHGAFFIWLINISALSGFIAWFGILLSHYRFRKLCQIKKLKIIDLPYKAKFYPFSFWFSFILLIFIIIGQQFFAIIYDHSNISNLIATYIGLPIFFLLFIIYKFKYKTKLVDLNNCEL